MLQEQESKTRLNTQLQVKYRRQPATLRGARAPGGGCPGYGAVPPPGYVCHRCHQRGHYIKHCPTNGDPAFEPRRLRSPVGIPASLLLQVADAPTAGPAAAAAVLAHPLGGLATNGASEAPEAPEQEKYQEEQQDDQNDINWDDMTTLASMGPVDGFPGYGYMEIVKGKGC
eukprot:m51a1_g7130 putative dwnn a cchc-type zinc finger (171) ;mRNA; r:236788-240594